MKTFFLSIIFLIISFFQVKSNILGIDFGTEYIKVSVLKPNSPFRMLENIQSKTKTPTAVAFKDQERLFGFDALGKKVRFPTQVFVYMHEFLGKKFSSPQIKKFLEEYFISYEIEEDNFRKTFNFKVNFNQKDFILSTEEIFGMLFRYIKYLSDITPGTKIKDCVITVPAFYGYKERLAISQAVELSDLKLLGITTENSAAAVKYSLDKEFEKPENIIFYNMGSSYVQATLVAFNSNSTNENNKQIKVLAETWDKNLGGNKLNYNFIKYLMGIFDNLESRKDKPSVAKDYKVAERILPSVMKYKEILSANKFTIINILGVENGINLNGKIDRETFEEINKEIFDKIYEPIEKLLNISGMKIEDITQIELLGGSVRIPKVQEVLRNKINPNLIGQHMNGDDSMAYGAGFISANFSSGFRAGKKIQFYHGPNYGIKINIKNKNAKKFEQNFTVYEIRNIYENVVKKIEIFYNFDFVIKIFQFFEEENQEEQNLEEENHLLNYRVDGVTKEMDFFKKYNATSNPRIELIFEMDTKGLLNLKAELVEEMELYVDVVKKPNGAMDFVLSPDFVQGYNPSLLEEELKKLNEMGANKTIINMVMMKMGIGKKKIQEVRRGLEVKVDYIGVMPMNANEIEESRKKLDFFDSFDEMRKKTMDAKNHLESEIYKIKGLLEMEESKNFIKEDEFEGVTQLVYETNHWYDEHGHSANLTILDSKYNQIKNKFQDIENRINSEKKRNFSVEKFTKELNTTKEIGKSILMNKPWVEDFYGEKFIPKIIEIERWFSQKMEKQNNLKSFEVKNLKKIF